MINVLRQAILAADPAIVETEKWNSPNFVFNGVDRVTLRVHPKGGVQVIFHRGTAKRLDVADFHFDDPSLTELPKSVRYELCKSAIFVGSWK